MLRHFEYMLKLQSSFTDIEPSTGWSVDPFGHSPTMAYLLKQSDIKSMVIQRVHYGLKQHLAKQKNFEFQWRQGWGMLIFRIRFLKFS